MLYWIHAILQVTFLSHQ